MTTTSRISNYGGVPTLFVNDEPQLGMAYITYYEERNRYLDFAQAGYKLYTFTTFFGDQTINESSWPAPMGGALFPAKGVFDPAPFEECVRHILEACPDAMIFPRVNMSLPRWWELENPDELNDGGTPSHPEKRRACFSSRKWLAQTEALLRQFIRHIEASDYKDHIVAYQLASGGTEEWFSFDGKGSQGPASRKLFVERGGNPDDLPAYHQFLSDINAENIIHLSGVAKEETQRRLAVGIFYGYTLECPYWQAPHHALGRILASANIDFLCSPASYRDTRAPGQDWCCITALDSLKLHGKAYFTELDIRTHLTKFMKECRPNACPPGTYEQPIWLGPKDPKVTEWILSAVIGRQLTHGTNSWWFDMWGGWYESPKLMAELAELRRIADDELHLTKRESIAEVGVFVDEAAYAHLEDGAISGPVCYRSRKALGLAGAMYDIFLASDFMAVRKRFKLCVFLVPVMTDTVQAAIDVCQAERIPYIVHDTPEQDLTTATLRKAYAAAGVHSWCDSDDSVNANENFLVIHTATAGRKMIRLPRPRTIRPLLPETADFTSDTIELDLQQFETRLFRLD